MNTTTTTRSIQEVVMSTPAVPITAAVATAAAHHRAPAVLTALRRIFSPPVRAAARAA